MDVSPAAVMAHEAAGIFKPYEEKFPGTAR